jgi:hypothetical protein
MSFLKDLTKFKESGISLVETTIAVGIIGIVMVGVMQNSKNQQGLYSSTMEKVVLKQYISTIKEMHSGDSSVFQLNFKPKKFLEMESYDELMKNLPIAWNSRVMTTPEKCPQCKGRMGYTLYPYSSVYRNLYILKIRVVHEKLFKNNYKDYHLLVKGK